MFQRMSSKIPGAWLQSISHQLSEQQDDSWPVALHRIIGGFLILLGIGLVALPVSHIVAEPEASPVIMAVGLIPVILALGVIGAGGWLFQHEISNRYTFRIGQWVLIGMLITSVMGVVILAYARHAGIYLSWFPALLTVTNNATAGTLGGFSIGFFNVRSKMQKEAIAAEREKLELTMRILRHDIRNDLTVIIGMADMLADEVPESGQQYLSKLKRSTEEAVDLTETAREFVSTVGEDDRDTKPIPLLPTVESQLETAQQTYSHAEFTVTGDIPAVRVTADEMLSSVFRNLFANAVQHNDKTTPVIDVSATDRSDEVEITIADNGPGIPDGRKKEVFGRGEKGLESSGTGLGLYLVDTLVEAYGGRVWITDNESTGSVFHLVLPIVQ